MYREIYLTDRRFNMISRAKKYVAVLLHSARAIIEADNEMQRIKDKIGTFHEI